MDEKKQIEEMARDLYHTRLTAKELCGGYDCKKCPKQNERFCDDMFQVDELQKLGYQNCKDKVVLTREEYEELKGLKPLPMLDYNELCACRIKQLEIENNGLRETFNRLFDKIQQARKETAREILKNISSVVHDNRQYGNDFVVIYYSEIQDLAKQYGVEVE